MAFDEPCWGPIQRRIMVFVLRRGGATIDEIAYHMARPSPDRGRVNRTIQSLMPRHIVEIDGIYRATAIGTEIALNVLNAAKDDELCRSIRFDAQRVTQ